MRLARLLRPSRVLTSRKLLPSAGVVVALLAIEYLGRSSPSDALDTIGVAALVAVAGLIVVHHESLPWTKILARRGEAIGRSVARLWCTVGVDLRETPPLRWGLPLAPVVLAGALVAAALVMSSANFHILASMRAVLAANAYVVWVVVLGLVWTSTLFGVFIAAVLPWMLIHDRFVQAFLGQGARSFRGEILATATYGCVLVAAAIFLPFTVAMHGILAATAIQIVLILLPWQPHLRILWKQRTGGPARTFGWRWLRLFEVACVAGVLLSLVSLTGATRADPRTFGTLPITSALGYVLGWAGFAMALGFLLLYLDFDLRLGFRDPARRARPVVHVAVPTEPRDRHDMRVALRTAGFAARFAPAEPAASDVTIDEMPDLGDTETVWRLRRRAEVKHRRLVLRTLSRLFKRAKRREFEDGTGFWIAPHLWFMVGLQRDEEDADLDEGGVVVQIIGPPYDRLLSRAARHDWYRLMRGIGIDLIYVEDGVSFRRLRTALRALFEFYDIHGGKRNIEERDLTGYRGMRAMIHEFGPEQPFESEVYPEPSYEFIGRARILHFFRDRDEDEEPLYLPADFGRVPVMGLR